MDPKETRCVYQRNMPNCTKCKKDAKKCKCAKTTKGAFDVSQILSAGGKKK